MSLLDCLLHFERKPSSEAVFLNELEKLVRRYGEVVEAHAADVVKDIALLPESKDAMRVKLLAAVKLTAPGSRREWLKSGYVLLADFQSLTSEQRDALARWTATVGINKFETMPDRIKDAVFTEIAEVGGVVTTLLSKVSSESQELLSDLRKAGL